MKTRHNLSFLLAFGVAAWCASAARAATDAEAVASVAVTPRVNVPFQIDFGFVNRSNTALNVKVTNTVPAEFTILSYSTLAGGGAACTNYGQQVVCTFPSTPPYASAVASVTVLSPIAGVFSNHTAMSRVLGDFNRTNDSFSLPITVAQVAARVRAFTVPETNATLPVAEIWLDAPSTVPVTVLFQTVGDGAAPGRHYLPLTNTVTFPSGTTSQVVSVTLFDNSLDEPELNFWIALLSATNADLLVGETYASVIIIDDDPPSADLALIVQQTDGGRLGGEFSMGVVIWNAGPEPVSNIMLTNRLPPGSTLRFEGFGNPRAGACVEMNGELICEIGSLPPVWGWTGILIGTTPRTGLQTNFITVGSERRDGNDSNNHGAAVFTVAPPLATVRVAAPGEFPENGSNALFIASLTLPSPDPVPVDYHTLDGTALEATDFVSAHGTLVFAPGVTNLTVPVPLLDDLLLEGPEQFSLMLSNAFGDHLTVPPATATILDNEPPPVVSLSDVTVVEGDSVLAEYGLTFTLSVTSPAPVRVSWHTGNGTALTPGDFYSTGNTVYFPPGETSVVDNFLLIRGNTTFEPTETFRIVLHSPVNATLARTEATVTILDDDAVPGRLDHFVITPVLSSPRIANRPFPISVQAVDAFGQLVTNFAGPATVRLRSTINGNESAVTPSTLQGFVNGVWSGSVAVLQVFTNGYLLVDDNVEHLGSSDPFFIIDRPPVRVTAPTNTVEGAGTLAGAGQISIGFAYGEDIVFALASSRPDNVSTPPTVTIPAGQTNAAFDLFVKDDMLLDGSSGANLTASASGFVTGSRIVPVHDDETAVLGWILPATILEGVQNVPVTLIISAPPDTNVSVTLSSTVPTRLQMPTSVSIAAGQTSRVFTVNVINDAVLQGPQGVELRAHVENWTDGVGGITLLDNESTNMILFWRGQEAPLLVEGQGTMNNAITINFGGTLTSNLVITLTSSDPTEVTVPATVTNLAGTGSVNFPITVMDDNEFDGVQTVTITASALGFSNGSRVATVQDNDVHHLAITGIPRPPTAAFPWSGRTFPVSISSRDVNDTNIFLPFDSPLRLALIGPNGPLAITPTNVPAGRRGSWSPLITPIGWGSNVVLVATTTNGITGQSAPFDITPPTWAATLRLARAEIAGNDVRLHLATQPGYTYQVERADELPAPAWTPVGPPVTAAGDLLVITDPGGATRPGRFYRLTLLP